MNVELTPELEQLVRSKVDSGRYASASEVVGEALRLFEEQDELLVLSKEEIRAQIEEGWQSARRGELVDGKAVFRRLEAELDAIERLTGK